MGVKWTTEQQQVIDLRGRNILVSAAAGSGKTAVLVERIITRLTEENPIDVDRLLVVTYTEAAAVEMKERIRDAIEKKLADNPEDAHLQRQATLIHNALITTIHSFCLSVIREHFHTIDLDPGFRIAEEGELKLLKHDVLQELLEHRYEEAEEEFLEFVERFATGRDDKKLEELILQLFEFSRSYPEPQTWLEKCVSAYEIADMEAMEQTPAVNLALRQVRNCANDALELLADAMKACNEPDGPGMYQPALESDIQCVQRFLDAEHYADMYEAAKAVKWAKLAPNRDKSVSETLSAYVKSIRDEVKKMIALMTERYFYAEPEELREDITGSLGVMETFTNLVGEFGRAFEKKKAEKNLIDFGDMEQFALRILTTTEDGKLVPSEVAGEYQEQFAEVMIDEYQDSNLIQEAILTSVSRVSKGEYNIFMVGDVKQSIYRFRLSRPELFMEKYETYDSEESLRQRIDLHKNFRSRHEVLDSTNFICKQIMTKELGGITYDEKAALYVGAAYETHPGNETEVLLVDTDIESEEAREVPETARELEARAAARRIKELVESHEIYDKATDSYRLAQYQDIVILTRSLKGWTDVFAKILNREGIPTYTGSKEGYFETQEVSIVLDYLRVLDNYRQDLPLTALLTSPIVRLSSEMLGQIRSANPEIPFYEAVAEYELHGEDKETKERLHAFWKQMERFRELVPYTAIHELLFRIVEETGYGDYVAAMPGGEQRKANLDMLVEKAMAFESTSYKGLFNFVRYIEQLQKYDIDYGEAGIEDEQSNTVRLMSIHKSKGLEFPIVFVAGMSKRFNTQDTKGSMVIHPELGIGIDAIDLEMRTKTPTFLKKVMQQEIQNENMGEELRVLYVALTRAKEKLIMIGSVSNFEKKLQEYARGKDRMETTLSQHQLTKANTYYDWVLPALIRHRSFAGVLKQYGMEAPFTNPLYQEEVPIHIRLISMEEIVADEVTEELEGMFTKSALLMWDTDKVYDEEQREEIARQFAYSYPFAGEEKLKLKFTVSELKKREYLSEESGEMLVEEPEVVPLLPRFMEKEEELKGASRGSAYHKVLELLDFTKEYEMESLSAVVAQFVEEERLSKEMAACIRMSDILTFLSTEAAKRMQNAAKEGLLRKEQPFVIGVRSDEIYPEDDSEETILVQGIIDVYFEEAGELVVLDYKTDRVRSGSELREKYHAQLAYYAKALEQLTGKRVKERLIYSFTLQEEIKV